MVADDRHDWVAERAQRTPGREALSFRGDAWTFARLDQEVAGRAAALQAAGALPGDRVALLAGAAPATVAAIHAVPRVGATLVPLNLRLTEAELLPQLELVQAGFLLADAAHEDLARRLGAAAAAHVLRIDATTPAPPPETPTAAAIPAERVHTIMFTSGTTGRPKGAMLTAGNHYASAVASMINLGVERDDRWLCCTPLFHMAGLSILIRSAIFGLPVTLLPGFDAEAANRAIDVDRVTIASVVPVMLTRMLDARGDRAFPAAFRCALTGGGPASEPLLRRCAAAGVPVTQTYGLTETASQVVTLAPEEALTRLGSAGRPLWGSRVRIVDAGGAPTDVGVAGEIEVRGPTVTPGYFGDAAATDAAFHDGWLRTGDLGCLDEAGYLTVLDRRTDLIISGGENVYPAELESVLEGHPSVAEACVVGVPDPEWGERPLACIVPAGDSLSAEELTAYCEERLASYKRPRAYVVVETLPRTAAGKLQRGLLRERVLGGGTD